MSVWNWEGFWSYFTNLYLLEGALWTIGLTISTLVLGGLLVALAILRPSRASLVLDLSGLSADQKLDDMRRLPQALGAERARHGTPHWVIHNEAHEQLWAADTQTARRRT